MDCVSSHECGRNGLADEDQLRLAAVEGRCLVTRNAKDYLPLTVRFAAEGEPHAGVLIVARSLANDDFAGIAAALVRYGEDHPAGLLAYLADYLTP